MEDSKVYFICLEIWKLKKDFEKGLRFCLTALIRRHETLNNSWLSGNLWMEIVIFI